MVRASPLFFLSPFPKLVYGFKPSGNMSQTGNLPQIFANIKKKWNHHLEKQCCTQQPNSLHLGGHIMWGFPPRTSKLHSSLWPASQVSKSSYQPLTRQWSLDARLQGSTTLVFSMIFWSFHVIIYSFFLETLWSLVTFAEIQKLQLGSCAT